jgi:hypothetical protein
VNRHRGSAFTYQLDRVRKQKRFLIVAGTRSSGPGKLRRAGIRSHATLTPACMSPQRKLRRAQELCVSGVGFQRGHHLSAKCGDVGDNTPPYEITFSKGSFVDPDGSRIHKVILDAQ